MKESRDFIESCYDYMESEFEISVEKGNNVVDTVNIRIKISILI